MDLTSQVTLMGGACDRASLVALRGRNEVDRALRDGSLLRTARGRYTVPTSPEFVRRASAFAGVLSHRSAAQYYGWAQKALPTKPEITVPRSRRLTVGARKLVLPHWSDLPPEDIDGMVTSRERTLIDCMRNLQLDESIPIVDSALRCDDFSSPAVIMLADSTQGRGRARIRAVSSTATSKSANSFESVLRAQSMLVPGLLAVAQLPVRLPGTRRVLHLDLADERLGIAIEAEGFEWHGKSAALTKDCRRYNALTQLGWHVIRFSWYMVMHDPTYVHETLLAAVASAHQHANVA